MRTGALILALLLLAPTWSGEASDKTVLIELELRSAAQPLKVSAGGAVVVGGLGTGGGFYWMPTTGVIYTGGLFATSVSRDGKVIVGQVIDRLLRQAASGSAARSGDRSGRSRMRCHATRFSAWRTTPAVTEKSSSATPTTGARCRTHSGGKSRPAWSIWAPASRAEAPSLSASPRTGKLPSAIRNKRRDSLKARSGSGRDKRECRGPTVSSGPRTPRTLTARSSSAGSAGQPPNVRAIRTFRAHGSGRATARSAWRRRDFAPLPVR